MGSRGLRSESWAGSTPVKSVVVQQLLMLVVFLVLTRHQPCQRSLHLFHFSVSSNVYSRRGSMGFRLVGRGLEPPTPVRSLRTSNYKSRFGS
jgi:hypothetical protein